MAGQEMHPGVYIEEIPSGAHAIAGVATSITVFVGRTAMGPVDEPLPIFNFGDYQRYYGGLSFACPVSYAVRDYFLNGGSEAVIVRLTAAEGSGSGAAATATADAGCGITLTAANPRSWANTGRCRRRSSRPACKPVFRR